MEIVVVSDTNIFIDLYNVDLLDEFFSLDIEIHTTDFVMNELIVEKQKKKIMEYHDRLFLKKFNAKELLELISFQHNLEKDTNVSVQDCSVWKYAQENDYMLLTGDRKLRGLAIKEGTNVCGILYLFDKMVEEHIISPQKACEKILQLKKQNVRLPSKEIDKRVEIWKKNIN